MKYQLGTALVGGRESIILYGRDAYFDLQALLTLWQSKQALSPEQVNPPVSLMEVMAVLERAACVHCGLDSR